MDKSPEVQLLKESLGLKQLIGKSPGFVAEIKKIPLIAKYDVSVLITGETGTGKELCARAIHFLSQRSAGPFVALNCGAMQPELLENEMFGHEAGAFTGSSGSRRGVIEEADRGTLFLDEIDSFPAQAMLLRFLQEGEFKPLGSSKTKTVNVRIIAATNIDIEQALHTHSLREDLYYRLSVISICLPPLRERKDDLPLLVTSFLSKWASQFGKDICGISQEAMNILILHDWPGNVRELDNTIERAVILANPSVIQAEDILLSRQNGRHLSDQSFHELKLRVVAQFEEAYLKNMLLSTHGNISEGARTAKMSRRTLRQLLEKYKIQHSEFASPRQKQSDL